MKSESLCVNLWSLFRSRASDNFQNPELIFELRSSSRLINAGCFREALCAVKQGVLLTGLISGRKVMRPNRCQLS